MEEINDIHTQDLEWGCICNLMDKIEGIEDKIDGHWDELIDMIVDAYSSNDMVKDASVLFFDLYQFYFRLYYRLRANPVKRPFNQVGKITIAGEDVYRVTNYDYKTFKWAKDAGFIMTISNDFIDLPADKLTDKQRRSLDRRIGDTK